MGKSKMRTGAISPRSILDNPTILEDDETHRQDKRRVLFEPSAKIINLRDRLVCDETVRWLARVSSPSFLFLGPVFENPPTVLSSVRHLPNSVTHLDLDLRNALHLLPEVMPILCSKTHIRTLSLRLFGDNGAIEFAKWIHKNPTLERLDLRGNRIGSRGARAIVNALVSCSHGLKYLNLSCNCIMNCDMIEELLIFGGLECLDLSFNWIGDDEIKQICRGLASKKCNSPLLRNINVFGCQRISDKGLSSILECIQHYNTSLWSIQVPEWNYKGSQIKEQINYGLKLNKAGRYLLQQNCRDNLPLHGLWPLVFQKINLQPESLYHFLRQGDVLQR
jgi:hypothetical protein